MSNANGFERTRVVAHKRAGCRSLSSAALAVCLLIALVAPPSGDQLPIRIDSGRLDVDHRPRDGANAEVGVARGRVFSANQPHGRRRSRERRAVGAPFRGQRDLGRGRSALSNPCSPPAGCVTSYLEVLDADLEEAGSHRRAK
jgi:hypothetical protein